MKNTIINFTITLILGIILGMFLPWWSVMIAAFITGLFMPLKGFQVFLIPFLAIMIYWIVYAFLLGNANDFILTKKIGLLFTLGESWILVILVTGIIGGFAAGISAIFGKQLSSVLSNKGR